MACLFMRPDEIATRGASVATSAGATDTDYTDEWLCDGEVGQPVRSTNGTVTWSATFTSAEVGLVVLANCDSDVNATLGGGVSGTVVAGALQPDGIRLNGFALQSPANETNITVAFSGAAQAVVLGELFAGKYRTLGLPLIATDQREPEDFTRRNSLDLASIAGYDPGLAARKWSGTWLMSTAEKAIVDGWFLAQRNGTRPGIVIPDDTVNDAWVCFIAKPVSRPANVPSKWFVEITFMEVPRVRW